MTRVYNFSAGPACLPEWVLKKAASEMLDAHNSGMSVMEMSHRSSEFQDIIDTCKARLKRLMNIPDEYEILFLQGGASLQFTMIPMNLEKHNVDLINTGQWTKKALKEHEKLGKVNVVASSAEDNFTYIPKIKQEDLSEDSDYVYICENNTIYGTKFKTLPNTKGKTLVADISSCFLSEPLDVSKFGILWGGVQKMSSAATISAREPSLSVRARFGQTPTDCSRLSPELLASRRTSVKVSLRQTAGRNTAVFLAAANALVTPRATTLRPFAASGLIMVTLVMTPLTH